MTHATTVIDLDQLAGMDLEAQLDAVLAVRDDEALAFCTICEALVPLDDSIPLDAGDDVDRVCIPCWDAHQADIAAELDADVRGMLANERALRDAPDALAASWAAMDAGADPPF